MEGGGEEESIRKAVSLHLPPPDVVEDLLTIGVCARCVFRLFGVHGNVYSSSLLSESALYSVIEELKGGKSASNENISGSHSPSNKDNCSICLGMLQFVVCSDQEKTGNSCKRTACLEDFTKEVSEIVRREGHEIDSFSMEISVPPVTLANERAFWLYMKKKYDDKKLSEEWFRKEKISIKDALKLSVTNLLQNHLNTKFSNDSFRIRLAYTHFDASRKLQSLLGEELGCKKRKFGQEKNHIFGKGVGDENGVQDSNVSIKKEHIEHVKSVSDAVVHKALEGLTDHVFSECFVLPPQKVSQPCNFTIVCYRTPIYIGGRYLKFSRRVSQSRWIIDDERMGEASVEEIIGSSVLLKCGGDSYKFHAAGREDIDVRMLGSGRPFLVEVSNARIMPSSISVQEIADAINNSKYKYVAVQKLKVLGTEVWDMMREGEAEKQKQYAALVWISRPLTEGDVEKLCSADDLEIVQKTPIRVLHRRSPLERKRIIHWMRIEKNTGNSQYFLLHLCTQAGTYIKELVHGDLGRTHPSIGSLLGCRAEILQLDVTDVKMDSFD